MLEVSTLQSPSKAAVQYAGFPTPDDYCGEDDPFMVVDDDDVNLLDYIDFTCCDVVPSLFDADGDILPDLEVDPTELLAEFEDHPAACGGAAAVETTKPPDDDDDKELEQSPGAGTEEEKKDLKKKGGGDHEATEDSAAAATGSSSDDSTNKSSASADNKQQQGEKKKTKPSKNYNKKKKVDWTPELHRRFVQAVEQLGIDKAVPSRILEIMGIQGLTRHNIASHLQKYRSHRKHLMAREAEAATWAHKRHMYAVAAAANNAPGRGGGGGGGGHVVVPRTTTKKQDAAGPAAPWVVMPPPTIGFPPFGVRPLHVWGHPPTAVDAGAAATLLPVWPRHLQHQAPPPAANYWHQQQYNNAAAARKWGPQTVTPCVAHPTMYRAPIIPTTTTIASLQLQLDAHHPSKESIDAAIGDVLVKPWLPLPLGLKPPALHSVMSELQKQGIPHIPPTTSHPRRHHRLN